ncbi:hypothetical protein WJX72_000311 [[Myrmecia] bisecta]|uniref:Uncharacterized protein n=1 Tax=[Myrmecia] bisecta TaxID=41462 RepID=A0AAW1PGH0_9CHLO
MQSASTPRQSAVGVGAQRTPFSRHNAITQQLNSDPRVTSALLADISSTLGTPLPTPAEFVRNLERQFQATNGANQQQQGGQQTPNLGQRAVSPTKRLKSELTQLLGSSEQLVRESRASRTSNDGEPQEGARSLNNQRSLSRTLSAPSHSPRAVLAAPNWLSASDASRRSGDFRQAARPADIRDQVAPQRQQLAYMLQSQYVDSLELSQFMQRTQQHQAALDLRPPGGLKFHDKVQTLLARIEAWEQLEAKSADQFRQKLERCFQPIHVSLNSPLPQPALVSPGRA